MGRADFDEAAPNRLPVPAGPARIPAMPDRFGTEALFGEPTPGPRPRPGRPVAPGDVDGQDELF
ncbi:hypothetical protein [Streptomyces sp. NPDC058672]|uniref:hypothetical protein n=1 Tax=Streptomyces sp. NPDC058672 TaxID=3346591 RepID=UPI0036641CCE